MGIIASRASVGIHGDVVLGVCSQLRNCTCWRFHGTGITTADFSTFLIGYYNKCCVVQARSPLCGLPPGNFKGLNTVRTNRRNFRY